MGAQEAMFSLVYLGTRQDLVFQIHYTFAINMNKHEYKVGEPVRGTVDERGILKIFSSDVNLVDENNKNVGIVTKVTSNSIVVEMPRL